MYIACSFILMKIKSFSYEMFSLSIRSKKEANSNSEMEVKSAYYMSQVAHQAYSCDRTDDGKCTNVTNRRSCVRLVNPISHWISGQLMNYTTDHNTLSCSCLLRVPHRLQNISMSSYLWQNMINCDINLTILNSLVAFWIQNGGISVSL